MSLSPPCLVDSNVEWEGYEFLQYTVWVERKVVCTKIPKNGISWLRQKGKFKAWGVTPNFTLGRFTNGAVISCRRYLAFPFQLWTFIFLEVKSNPQKKD
ncbi:unnamed protein product [Blepharisma stoltei]|uniref:Uncharacterized protein n=1 Tax=Blepharisma stoltei TaxID=1481888 RepID=A0AAU9K1T9_9CILI|nr:unnamed protein product [Blepharisma stoltei]